MSLIQAEQVEVTIANAIASPNTTTDFQTAIEAVGTNEIKFAAVSKGLDLKSPERTTSEVKLLGATSGVQNQENDPQSPSKAEFTGTLIANPESDSANDFEQFMLTISATKPTGYDYRYNFASAAPTAGVAVVIQINQGSSNAIVNWLMNNATVETLGGFKIDADGHGEQEIRVSCAANDLWKEWDADGGS